MKFASISVQFAKLRKLAICAFMVMVAGCATTTPAVQPVEVKVPVAVPCKVPMPERPAFAVDGLPLGSGIWDQMKALRAERWQRQGYETELEAAVKACQ
jgi:hypothetical protein